MKIQLRFLSKSLEVVLSIIIALATVNFTVQGMLPFLTADWSQTQTFYNFISFILLVLVGLELSRLMVSHSIANVIELIILIVSRKMLTPQATSMDILLSSIAIIVLIATSYVYSRKPLQTLEDLSN